MIKVENIHFRPKVLGTSGKILMLKQNVSSFGIFMLQNNFWQIMKVEFFFPLPAQNIGQNEKKSKRPRKNWADWKELYSGCPEKFWLSPTIPDL
jgi:hypothetical protein